MSLRVASTATPTCPLPPPIPVLSQTPPLATRHGSNIHFAHQVDYYFYFVFTIGLLLALLLFIAATAVLRCWCCSTALATHSIVSQHAYAALFVVYLMHPSVSQTFIQMLNPCEEYEGVGRRLQADLSIECDGPVYSAFHTAALYGFLGFSLGIPLLYAAILLYNHDELYPDEALQARASELREIVGEGARSQTDVKEGTRAWHVLKQAKAELGEVEQLERRQEMVEGSLGFVYKGYKKNHYFMESAMMLLKLLVTGVTRTLVCISPHPPWCSASPTLLQRLILLSWPHNDMSHYR